MANALTRAAYARGCFLGAAIGVALRWSPRRWVRVMWTEPLGAALRVAAAPRGARTGWTAAAPTAAAAARGVNVDRRELEELTTAWAAARLAAQDGAVLVILSKIKLAAGKMESGLGSAGFL